MANYSTRKERHSFYLSADWRNMRAYKLQLMPYCEECAKNGKIVPATEVHHIIDIVDAPDLILSFDNLQCLCHACHSSITFKRTRSKNKAKRGHLKLRYGLK